MKSNLLLKALLGIALFSSAFSVSKAQLLTFDTLPGNQTSVPNGYGGLTWNNFSDLDSSTLPNSGYFNGTVSAKNVAYNPFANPASITSLTAFNFTSLYLTAAWNDGLTVRIEGFLAGSLLYSDSLIVNTSGPTFELLNFNGVDEVRFASAGGVHNDAFGGSGTHFVIDNVQLNGTPVPEPSTYGLFGAVALLGLVAFRRRAVKK